MSQYEVVWQCTKCSTTLTVKATNSSGGEPNRNGCPKDGQSHDWNRLSSSELK